MEDVQQKVCDEKEWLNKLHVLKNQFFYYSRVPFK